MPFVHMVCALFAGFGLALVVFPFAVWIESRFIDESDDDPREWYGI